MGGFFSSPSDLERQATANMYRNFSPPASGSNSATPVNSGTPATRRNRKTTQYGGKRKHRRNKTTKRR